MSGFRIGTINRRRADIIIVVVHESTAKLKSAEIKKKQFFTSLSHKSKIIIFLNLFRDIVTLRKNVDFVECKSI